MLSETQTLKALVLVVDDEPLLRLATMNLVEEAGLEAIEASNADEAIAILEGRGDIRIVLTDVNMPGSMDGLKLAAAVRDRWPPIKIIVVSGKHALAPRDLPPGALFFPKPIPARDVIAALKSLAFSASA